jgi:hypothetical protein
MKKSSLFLSTVALVARLAYSGPQVQVTDVVGVWEGNLHVFGQSVPLVYKISLSKNGTLTAFHDTPDYGFRSYSSAGAKILNSSWNTWFRVWGEQVSQNSIISIRLPKKEMMDGT